MPSGSPDGFEITALLCDAAQVVGGKLFILGGGWDRILNPSQPTSMALALVIHVPWNRANERHQVTAALVTEDSGPVRPQPAADPIRVEGQFEIGRPVGTRPGSSLSVPLAINVAPILLQSGGYRWEIAIDGAIHETLPFQVGGG